MCRHMTDQKGPPLQGTGKPKMAQQGESQQLEKEVPSC